MWAHLSHVLVISLQVPQGLWLEEVVSAGETQLRLVNLENVLLAVSVIRTHPQVHQHSSVKPLPDHSHSDLQTVRRLPVSVKEGEWPASKILETFSERMITNLDYLRHVDTRLVEML